METTPRPWQPGQGQRCIPGDPRRLLQGQDADWPRPPGQGRPTKIPARSRWRLLQGQDAARRRTTAGRTFSPTTWLLRPIQVCSKVSDLLPSVWKNMKVKFSLTLHSSYLSVWSVAKCLKKCEDKIFTLSAYLPLICSKVSEKCKVYVLVIFALIACLTAK